MRGQAIVEFALILPIFLFVIVGGFQVWLYERTDFEILHAATQAADAGAAQEFVPDRCATARETIDASLDFMPDSVDCHSDNSVSGENVVVTIRHQVQPVAPMMENFPNLLQIEITASAPVIP